MSDPRLKIDKFSLDDELIANPSLVQGICNEAAEAIAVRDAKKDALKTTEAELDTEIRNFLANTNTKITEKMVEVAVQVNPRRKKAFDEWNQAALTAAKAHSLVEAVSTRAEALKELSKLYISGYFAIDSTKRSAITQELQYNRARERLADKRLQK